MSLRKLGLGLLAFSIGCGASSSPSALDKGWSAEIGVIFLDGGASRDGAVPSNDATRPADGSLPRDTSVPPDNQSPAADLARPPIPAGSVDCPTPHAGWKCLTLDLINTANGVSYRVQYRWNLPAQPQIHATALWVAGGNGTWSADLMNESLATQNKLATSDAIRSVIIDFIDAPQTGVAHSGGYWHALDGYRVAAKIYDVAVRRLIAAGLYQGNYLSHIGGSNGTNMAAFALAYHGADAYLDQVVFNAGPISIDLEDECGKASSPAHIDVGGKTRGDQVAKLADTWMGWDDDAAQRYCQRRAAPAGADAERISNLDDAAQRDFPSLTVHTIVGMQDGFGLWLLRSNRKWFDGIKARHMTLDCDDQLGHEMDWDRTYTYVSRGPQQSALHRASANCTSFPVPSASAGIKGNLDGITTSGGTTRVTGWACFAGYYRAIDVHVYAGGAVGVGTLVKGARADLLNEKAVNSACSTSGVPHRFSIPLTAQELATHSGKAIYVHGIAPTGFPNLLIGGSGNYTLP